MGLCAIHEVGFYTDHDDAWGCGLHSNCFGVFRMMHFADDAFLMRILYMVSQKKVLSELLVLALIIGACRNFLCRSPLDDFVNLMDFIISCICISHTTACVLRSLE